MDVLLLILRVLLAALLYAFLGTIVLILWRDLRQTEGEESVAKPAGHLTLLQVGDEQMDKGTVFPLRPVTSIGRAGNNTVILADTYASAEHALLTWREGQWWIEDQDSRNGTLLNGTQVNTPTVVSAGDIIGVGRARLRLELE